MDLFDEVENLAVSAAYDEPDEDDPSQGTIKMFQERFGYTYDQAAELVGITRNVKIAAATTHQAIISSKSTHYLCAETRRPNLHSAKGPNRRESFHGARVLPW